MGNRKIVLILAMGVLSMSAGIVVGWALTPHGPGGHGGPRPWFDQLGLSIDQQKQMDKIWGDTRRRCRRCSNIAMKWKRIAISR